MAFEIYPLSKNQLETVQNLRLGFAIENFEETLKLLEDNNITISKPELTNFGFLTVVSDPDGRKIELYKK
nr:hypothetical protein [Flavobacterium aquatile]